MQTTARAAVDSLVQQWYSDFAPVSSPDLLPSLPLKHRDATATPSPADKSASASSTSPNSTAAGAPLPGVIGTYTLPSEQWMHQIRPVTAASPDAPCFAVTFAQPTRSKPVAPATATIWVTYHSAVKATVRFESMAYVHTFVRKDGGSGGRWVHQSSGASINVFKWCTEIIRSKLMVHDGAYAGVYRHVFPTGAAMA